MLAKLNGRNGGSRRRLPSGGLDATLSSAPAPQARRAGKGFRDRTLSVRPKVLCISAPGQPAGAHS